MGRNQEKRSIRNEQKNQRHEDRYHDRQAGNLGQDKRPFILRHRAGPGDQRSKLGATVMAGVVITAAMKIERPDRGLFEFIEAGRANDPSD